MRNIKLGLLLLLLVPAGLWLLADTLAPRPFTYFSFREVFVQLTGVLAIVAMSAAMVLATRPTWLEPHLGGLDKIYRLHKWLGIAALAISTAHWWWAYGTKLMVGWGWLERPQRGPGPGGPAAAGIEGWMRGQRGLAESVGEWAFYAAAILLVLALVPRFPYHLFKKVHVWLAAVFLALVYHALVLTRFSYWSQPIGWLLAVLLVAGVASAILTLLGRIGAGRKVQGSIEDLVYYPSLQVLESSIRLDEGWKGHEPGQFAFVTSDRNEGAHPYTIASAWDPAERRIVFITKALGDHTRRLRERLKPGGPAGNGGRALRLLHLPRRSAGPDLGGCGHRYHALHRAHEASGASSPAAGHPPFPSHRRLRAGGDRQAHRRCQSRGRDAPHPREPARRAPDRRSYPRGRAAMARGQPLVLRPRRLRPGLAPGFPQRRPAGQALPPGAVPNALGPRRGTRSAFYRRDACGQGPKMPRYTG